MGKASGVAPLVDPFDEISWPRVLFRLESFDEERCIPPYLSHWKIQNFSCCVQVETLSFATNFRGAEISIETKSFGTPEIMSLIIHIYYCKGVPGKILLPGVGKFFLTSKLDPHLLPYIVILHVDFPF